MCKNCDSSSPATNTQAGKVPGNIFGIPDNSKPSAGVVASAESSVQVEMEMLRERIKTAERNDEITRAANLKANDMILNLRANLRAAETGIATLTRFNTALETDKQSLLQELEEMEHNGSILFSFDQRAAAGVLLVTRLQELIEKHRIAEPSNQSA